MKPLITALYLFAAESLYWHVPGRYDFHFFVAAICLLWWIMEVDMQQLGFFDVEKSGELNFDDMRFNILSHPTGDDLKRQGLAQITKKNKAWIERAQAEVRIHLAIYDEVSANHLHQWIEEGRLPPAPHNNCFGAVFSGIKGLKRLRYDPTSRPQARNRGGGVSVWGVK